MDATMQKNSDGTLRTPPTLVIIGITTGPDFLPVRAAS